jgi:hypothetical protein
MSSFLRVGIRTTNRSNVYEILDRALWSLFFALCSAPCAPFFRMYVVECFWLMDMIFDITEASATRKLENAVRATLIHVNMIPPHISLVKDIVSCLSIG